MSIFLTNLPSSHDNVNMPAHCSPQEMRPAMAAFFHAYQAFTMHADQMLAERGFARVHHRILFFVASQPGLSIKTLLAALGVSKQALNLPLRQLISAGLIEAHTLSHDRRVKSLRLTPAGAELETALHEAQRQLLTHAFEQAGPDASAHWLALNQALAALRG